MGPLAAPTRAGLLALAAAVLGLAAHGEAGGATSPSVTTLVVGLGVVLVTARLATAPPRPWRTAAVLAAGQLAMHLAQEEGHAGHAMPGMTGDSAGGGLGMVGAHLTVAVLVAAGVVHADRSLVAAARHAVARVHTVLLGAPAPPPSAAVTRPVEGPPATTPVATRLTRLHPRRGPPSGLHAPTPIPHGRTPSCPVPGRRAPSSSS